MPKKKAKTKIFWPCGDNTGLGCGKECYQGVPHILRIKQPGKRARNVVFCSKCAKAIKDNNNYLNLGAKGEIGQTPNMA